MAVAADSAAGQPVEPQPLAANDVSILFPPPKTTADLDNLIAATDLARLAPGAQPGRLWSDADFASFLAIAENPAVQVAGTGLAIRLPPAVQQIDAWFIAGIRIDPGAPGLSKQIIEQFGQQPQIRFVVQPLTRQPNGAVRIHDIAAHLIFGFSPTFDQPTAAGCLPRPKPDMDKFKAVVRDIAVLRDRLAAGQFGGTPITTTGPLGVHPGLTGASAKPFRDALKDMLEQRLATQPLGAMAIMALDAPEPWIFLAMQKVAREGSFVFVPVPGPTLDGQQFAQMLSFRGGKHVLPAPTTNNQNPITCRHAAQNPPLPTTDRKGVATADFLDGSVPAGAVQEIVDIVADPAKSHFFNTDCVSCHTDTRQAMKLIGNATISGVNPAALPQRDWNVRNFGWFPSGSGGDATVTRRTATETAEVVEFINRELLGK
jgi:hypothetical protein